jgi:hypothetical protein
MGERAVSPSASVSVAISNRGQLRFVLPRYSHGGELLVLRYPGRRGDLPLRWERAKTVVTHGFSVRKVLSSPPVECSEQLAGAPNRAGCCSGSSLVSGRAWDSVAGAVGTFVPKSPTTYEAAIMR